MVSQNSKLKGTVMDYDGDVGGQTVQHLLYLLTCKVVCICVVEGVVPGVLGVIAESERETSQLTSEHIKWTLLISLPPISLGPLE
jgi:hypothetical protein